MASNKRCHYEVLGLSRDCTADEIRSAYKKLALQLHTEKLIQSGLAREQATAQFQDLSLAYEVLSDPKERAWYDSHRSQILFSDPTSADSVPDSVIPNLFSFFFNTVFPGYSHTGRGFYKVYSDVFNNIYANEVSYCRKLGLRLDGVREAPMMGNLESEYAQVTAFYNYWLGFCTVMDFFWVDQYDVMAGPNRKSRRVMEEENKKLRKKAKRQYNETVRGLAEFVKKRDKRVIDMMVKKNAEMERKKEEEKQRRKKLEKERMERLRAYEEPAWVRVNEEEMDGMEGFDEEEGKKKGNGGKELYCVVCGKKLKSEKQWENHEQSRKHKEKVAELRESIQDEDEERDDFDDDVQDDYVDHNVEKIEESFKEDFKIREEGDVDGAEVLHSSEKKEGFVDATGHDDGVSGVGEGYGSADKNDDEEISIIEAMLSGRNGRRNRGWRHVNQDFPQDIHIEGMKQESEVAYDKHKTRRKGRKARGQNNGGGDVKSDIDESKSSNEEHDKEKMESSSNCFVENEDDGNKSDDQVGNNDKSLNQSTNKKGAKKKETNVKSKNSSKGQKGKATSKDSGNVCDTCGVEFESRNKLHKHLGGTGHATLKFRRGKFF